VDNGKMPGMNDRRQLVLQLFKMAQVSLPADREEAFQHFLQRDETGEIIDRIIEQKTLLMGKWKLEDRIAEIVQQPVRIANATVGKPYEAVLDFEKLGWQDITEYDFANTKNWVSSSTKNNTGYQERPFKAATSYFTFGLRWMASHQRRHLPKKRFR
jgi:hypothetical protein